MARQLELEVANFVCRFGDKFVMNDLLDEVVIPAFYAESTRETRGGEYFFLDQDFRYLKGTDPTSLALCCRLVKNTILRRHQIYSRTKGLVPDEREMESAPSSIAVLLLYSHRLLFIREVPDAPSVHQYGTTFKHRMRTAVMDHWNALYLQRRQAGEKVTKKGLKEAIPIPDIDVVPIVSSQSLRDFINRFDSLNTLKIEVAPTNNEIDNEEFFRTLRGAKRDVGSAKTVVQHHHPQGLNKKGCYEQVEAAKQGNAVVEMRGTDTNGDDLKGDNDHFSVRAPLGAEEVNLDQGVRLAFDRYKDLEARGVVSTGRQQEDYRQKLQQSFRRHSRSSDDE